MARRKAPKPKAAPSSEVASLCSRSNCLSSVSIIMLMTGMIRATMETKSPKVITSPSGADRPPRKSARKSRTSGREKSVDPTEKSSSLSRSRSWSSETKRINSRNSGKPIVPLLPDTASSKRALARRCSSMSEVDLGKSLASSLATFLGPTLPVSSGSAPRKLSRCARTSSSEKPLLLASASARSRRLCLSMASASHKPTRAGDCGGCAAPSRGGG
mmetsp:Transcript_28643/g.72597  ORF Transcript_28643/g.72597 Transcript_28643/m.72597 type:complete len:216 (-) Transcript_28643:1-648(-)